MLLNFQIRFVPRIESGEKTHTIRATRKRPPKVGEICHCYTGLRQKGARLLGRWTCLRVEKIEIEGGWETISGEFFGDVRIENASLLNDEREQLARRDGFASFADMAEFWRGRLPFEGTIIHWEFTSKVQINGRVNKRKCQI